jgi:uncharacterized protein (TIGR02722 family)
MFKKVSLLMVLLAFTSSCADKAFVKGKYEDVEKENLMNDQWSETDMQVVAKDLVKGLVGSVAIAGAKKPPVVIVTQLQNKTSEHIDTQSIMDMIRVELMNSGKVQFIDKEAREDIKNEYDYNGSGMVSEESKKTAGGQTGADFIINGRLDSIVQEVGKDKTVYYKITLNLTNIKTSVISWSDHKQIRKAFKKKSIGF